MSDRGDKIDSFPVTGGKTGLRNNQDYAGLWNRTLTVPMVTLDSLIQRYGMPLYIKIDVEEYQRTALHRALDSRTCCRSNSTALSWTRSASHRQPYF